MKHRCSACPVAVAHLGRRNHHKHCDMYTAKIFALVPDEVFLPVH